jgi:hypothetical protein
MAERPIHGRVIRPAVGQITRAVVRPTSGRLVSFHPKPRQIMGRNWVTDSYMNGGDRPSRYEKTSQRWRELEVRLQR